MPSAITKKLEEILNTGITKELEVVYLMAGIRKLLEQQHAKSQYRYLTFHCDWTLHSKLRGPAAQEVLRHFDAANLRFKAGHHFDGLPRDLQRELENFAEMKHSEKELEAFLLANGLPTIEKARRDGWIHFLHLYAKVVQDCPLVISGESLTVSSIESVTVQLEIANQPQGENMPFRVTWTILDKNGLTGAFFVIN